MRKKRLVALILAVVLILVLPVGVYFYPALFGNKNNNGDGDNNTPQGPTNLSAIIAATLKKITSLNYSIFDTYAENSEVDNYYYVDGGSSEIENYANVALTKDQLNNYFRSLQTCVMVPAALDFVVNSIGSEVYQNPFEVGQTYYCKEITPEETYIYYYKAEMEDSLINLYLENDGYFIICQIEYDFDNEKLISAKTLTEYMFAEINYPQNTFTVAQFEFDGVLNDVLAGNFDVDDIIPNVRNVKYNGNITNNINRVRFDEVSLATPEAFDEITRQEIQDFMDGFAFNIKTEEVFDKADVEINNSFADAMDYAVERLNFEIAQNPENPLEFEFISTWVKHEDAVKFLDDLSKSDDVKANVMMKSLVLAFKNWLSANETSYTGDLNYIIPNPDTTKSDLQLSISKTNKDLSAFIVTIVVGESADDILELSCKYNDGVLSTLKREDATEGDSNNYFEPDTYYYTLETDSNNPEHKYIDLDYIYTYGKVANVPAQIEVEGVMYNVEVLDRFSVTFAYGDGGVLNIPATVRKIDVSSWLDVSAINVDADNPYFTSDKGVLFDKNKTTLIRYPACATQETYTIPSTVTKIEDGAFQGDQNLKTLTVPASVQEGLVARVFYAVNKLENINVIPNKYYTSFNGAVYSGNGETLICCPAGKKGSFTVRNSVKYIGEAAFEYCRYLTEINMSSTVTTFEAYAFRLCEALEKLTIPANLESAVYFDFDGMNSLKQVIVQEGCELFAVDSKGLVYSADYKTLYFCPRNYKGELTIDSRVEIINGYAFDSVKGITKVTIPESVSVIGDRAFMSSSVTEIVIQGTVSIDYEAFFRSDLTKLTINGLSKLSDEDYCMGWDAVDECDYLTVIYFGGTTQEWEDSLDDSFDYWDIPTLKVVCSNGELFYTA